jgi:predicted nucleotidyltransferase
MSLVRITRAILDERGVRYMIGAHAAAVYGVIRSTKDVDFLTVDRTVLRDEVWARAASEGATVKVLIGDFDDPLAGTVRLLRGVEQVDVVVGKWKFEEAIIERAEERVFDGVACRVPRAADLVLLKLAAGGPQDFWDIHELMRYVDVRDEVGERIGALPRDARSAWERILAEST